MNSKERVIKTLNFQRSDKIAIFDSFWVEFVENWHKEKGIGQEVDIYDYYGIDLSVLLADETFFPSSKGLLRKEGNYSISRDGWGRTVKTREGASFSQTIDTVLKNRNNLDNLEFEPADLDCRYQNFVEGERLDCHYQNFLEGVKEEKKKRYVLCSISGPFTSSSLIRGEAEFLMDLVSDKVFAKALVEKVADHLLSIGLESLCRGNLYDSGVWISDDMGFNNALMFSPKIFEEIFLLVYKKIVSSLKKAGVRKVILHSDGNIVSFLDMLIEAGIDGINPVEPKAGMNILKLKKKYNNKLSYIGGVDNAFVLPSGDKERIKKDILPILEAGKEGGIVIGAHSIGPDISVEAYDYYHSLVRKYGYYEQE